MKRFWLGVGLSVGLGGWVPAEAADAPAVNAAVDFETQVRPILQARCLSCHSRGKYKGGLSLETRAQLLKGGEEGPAAVVGKAHESLLLKLVRGEEEGRRMPEKGPALDAGQIDVLKAWIDQGLSWPEAVDFGFRKAPIEPRTPEIPPTATGFASENPVDRFIARNLEGRGKTPDARPVDDRVFARRASLDLLGLLPAPERVEALSKDDRPDKRERFVDGLLADRRDYAEHWLTFWNDALRNAYRGPGFIDGGRKTITGWLFRALYENTPYDQFVRSLVSPGPASEGFTKGIVWRGTVNASQAPPVQAAQNVAQVFLGTNLKCASCHDSFVNHWKLNDAYALSAVFAPKTLEVHRCDKPTGTNAEVGFIYPSLGSIEPSADRASRMAQLADLLVKPENGRLSRAIVNRLWAQLMGRGLVEPLDDLDQPPWDQDLLDWLATDLVAHKYDLKHTLRLIATSRAYQLPSVGRPGASFGPSADFVFAGPVTKRMGAEAFLDALATLTGDWPQPTDDLKKVDGRGQGGQLNAVLETLKNEPGGLGPVRASLLFDDPLQAALGRTNREQVVTRRDSVATTLEALELTNGLTLDATLRRGASKLLAAKPGRPEDLATRLYLTALGRPPADHERAEAARLMGTPLSPEGLQDFLWALVMLPEFQLIR